MATDAHERPVVQPLSLFMIIFRFHVHQNFSVAPFPFYRNKYRIFQCWEAFGQTRFPCDPMPNVR